MSEVTFIKLATNWGGGCEWQAPEECAHGEAEYVDVQSYEAAQVELAALREELAKYRNLNDSLMARNLELTAAEQRNAVMTKALERITRPHDCGCVPCTGSCTSKYALEITLEEIREIAGAALQPTESGASES